jgi:cell division initiation protein
MPKITVVDIQHKTFKKALQGYDRAEVDQFLDDLIESLEDEAHARAALEAEIADLRERISHFKSMEESLQNTLILAQRTADEVKASAHKEADLIKQQARVEADREVAALADRTTDARREHQRALEQTEQAKSELRSLLMTHLALLDRGLGDVAFGHGGSNGTWAPLAGSPAGSAGPEQRATLTGSVAPEADDLGVPPSFVSVPDGTSVPA